MGVSGSGKSYVARLLAQEIDGFFVEGDDFHTQNNIEKMQNGISLQDEDRWPWLSAIKDYLFEHSNKTLVLAASLLKESHRVASGVRACADRIYFLHGPKETITERLHKREQSGEHFMPASLIDSQCATLEEPNDAVTISIQDTPEMIVAKIMKDLRGIGLCP